MSVLDEIRAAADQLREGEAEASDNRRLSDTTWKQLHEFGVLRAPTQAVGRRRAGPARTPHQRLRDRALRALDRVGDRRGVLPSLAARALRRADQQDMWNVDPARNTSSSYAPTGKAEIVDGGFRLSGRWSFSSGCDLCDGVILGANAGFVQFGEVEIPNFHSFVLLRDQYTIDDNWFTAGMRGTGSKDIVVDNAFVPAHRGLSSIEYEYNPQNRLRVSNSTTAGSTGPSAVMFNLVLVAPMLGAARGFLDAWTAETARRKLNWGGLVRDDSLTQLHLAEAEYVHQAAMDRMYDAIDTISAAAKSGTYLDKPERARLRWGITKGCQEVGRSVNQLYRISRPHRIRDPPPAPAVPGRHHRTRSRVPGLGRNRPVLRRGRLGASAPEVML